MGRNCLSLCLPTCARVRCFQVAAVIPDCTTEPASAASVALLLLLAWRMAMQAATIGFGDKLQVTFSSLCVARENGEEHGHGGLISIMMNLQNEIFPTALTSGEIACQEFQPDKVHAISCVFPFKEYLSRNALQAWHLNLRFIVAFAAARLLIGLMTASRASTSSSSTPKTVLLVTLFHTQSYQ